MENKKIFTVYHNLTLSGKGRKINLGEATVRKSEIRTPDASPEVIDGIRTKSKRTRVFQRRVLVGVTLASIVFFLIVVLPIFKKETVKAEHVNEERIRKQKQWEEKLTFFTEDARKWVAERHYDNAIIQYRNALTMQVTDRRIWQEFIYVLVLNCSINEQNCREAEFYTIAYQSFPAELQDEKFLHQIEFVERYYSLKLFFKLQIITFTLLFRTCTTKTTGSPFFLQQWIITGTGSGKLTVFFCPDFYSNSCKSKSQKQYGNQD